MDNKAIIDEVVENAYKNITAIADYNLLVSGKYIDLILTGDIKTYANYLDEIVNKLFWKFCDVLSNKITDDDIEFVMYKTFVNNKPSKELVEDCFKIVNDCIKKKNSSENTTIYSLLTPLKEKYSKEEIEKGIDTIFDIILSYYSIKRN